MTEAIQPNAIRLVIVAEKLLLKQIKALIDAAGVSGYTITATGGKGSRNVRSSGPAVSDTFANVKIEVITADADSARRIADEVMRRFFDNYSGIIWLHEVEVCRVQKFQIRAGGE